MIEAFLGSRKQPINGVAVRPGYKFLRGAQMAGLRPSDACRKLGATVVVDIVDGSAVGEGEKVVGFGSVSARLCLTSPRSLELHTVEIGTVSSSWRRQTMCTLAQATEDVHFLRSGHTSRRASPSQWPTPQSREVSSRCALVFLDYQRRRHTSQCLWSGSGALTLTPSSTSAGTDADVTRSLQRRH